MNDDLDIEPDETLGPDSFGGEDFLSPAEAREQLTIDHPASQRMLETQVADGVTIQYVAGAFLPKNFPLTTLLRFMPDVKLKQNADRLADAAMAIDVKCEDGLAKADVALANLRAATSRIEAAFVEPVRLAHELHKRLTGLRSDFTARSVNVQDIVSRSIYAETKRRKQLAEEQRRRDQEAADAEARAQAKQLAKDAAARHASKETVAALKEQAKVATAPPVTSSLAPPPLQRSAPVERWKGQFIGTPEGEEVNPEMAVLTPAQQEHARAFFKAIADGTVPLVFACINWSEVNRKAHAERTTFLVPGLEAVDVGGLRSKGKR